MYTKYMPKKKALSDKERQAFIDKLPEDQKNPDPKARFDELVSLASTTPVPKDSEQSVADEGYNGKRTRSHKAEDTLDSRSDKSHQ